uniref:Uncharacterized protein n=1 Tax=Graphocephala atropunctata TaxID=36148 RepID=A0A1B6MC37_9HEMI
MSDCPLACTLAVLAVCSGLSLFIKPVLKNNSNCNDCISVPTLYFLTSMFVWVSATNIYIFKCKLPEKAAFVYEFLVSIFIFEMALKYFWEPIECYIVATLPKYWEQNVLDGDCVMCGMMCPGNSLIFTVLAHIVAGSWLWLTFRGFGIDAECLDCVFQHYCS